MAKEISGVNLHRPEYSILNEAGVTSGMGQKAKYSARADVFRSTPRNGHRQAGLVGPVRAMSGS